MNHLEGQHYGCAKWQIQMISWYHKTPSAPQVAMFSSKEGWQILTFDSSQDRHQNHCHFKGELYRNTSFSVWSHDEPCGSFWFWKELSLSFYQADQLPPTLHWNLPLLLMCLKSYLVFLRFVSDSKQRNKSSKLRAPFSNVILKVQKLEIGFYSTVYRWKPNTISRLNSSMCHDSSKSQTQASAAMAFPSMSFVSTGADTLRASALVHKMERSTY